MSAAMRKLALGALVLVALLALAFVLLRDSGGAAFVAPDASSTVEAATIASTTPSSDAPTLDVGREVEHERVATPLFGHSAAEDYTATVFGRVLRDACVVAGVDARLRRHALTGRGVDARYDLDATSGRERRMHSANDGSFLFEYLGAGTYELVLHSLNDDELVLAPLVVALREEHDVGNLTFEAHASIHGTVLGFDDFPEHWAVYVHLMPLPSNSADPEESKQIAWTKKTRREMVDVPRKPRFDFDELRAGRYAIYVQVGRAKFMERDPLVIDVEPGERREVSIDLRALVGARLVLTLRHNGNQRALTRGRITCDASDEPIEFTFADNVAFVAVPPTSMARLRVCSELGLTLHEEDLGELRGFNRVERTIDLDLGILSVAKPAYIATGDSDAEFIALSVRSSDGAREVLTSCAPVWVLDRPETSFSAGEPERTSDQIKQIMGLDAVFTEQLPGTLIFGVVPVGRFDVVIRFESHATPPAHAPVEFFAIVEIRRGETTRAVLRQR